MTQPPRLEKQEDNNRSVWDVINMYGFIFIPILFIILIGLVACLINALGGFACVESGNVYYHMV